MPARGAVALPRLQKTGSATPARAKARGAAVTRSPHPPASVRYEGAERALSGAFQPALLAQTVKAASDEAAVAVMEREAAVQAKANLQRQWRQEAAAFKAEREQLVATIARLQAENATAECTAATAQLTIAEQTRNLSEQVQGLQALNASSISKYEGQVAQLRETIRRQKEQLAAIALEYKQSAAMAAKLSGQEQALLRQEVSRLKGLLTHESSNRSTAHVELISANEKVHNLMQEIARCTHELDLAKHRGDTLFREKDDLQREIAQATALQEQAHSEAEAREQQARSRIPDLENAASASETAREQMATRALEAETALGEVLRANEEVRFGLRDNQTKLESVVAELALKKREVEQLLAASERQQSDLAASRALASEAKAAAAVTQAQLAGQLEAAHHTVEVQGSKLLRLEGRTQELTQDLVAAKELVSNMEADRSHEHATDTTSWQQSQIAASAEIETLKCQIDTQKRKTADLEADLAKKNATIQRLKLDVAEHSHGLQKATLQAVQHMNRKDVELLAATSVMQASVSKVESVLKAVEHDRDTLQLDRDGLHTEIQSHSSSIQMLAQGIDEERERSAELNRLLAVQTRQAAEALEGTRLAHVSQLSKLREELATDARTKEEALYTLALELSAKVHSFECSESSAFTSLRPPAPMLVQTAPYDTTQQASTN
jgi:chromosome segregation ATPase